MTEYNALPGSRKLEMVAAPAAGGGPAVGGGRNFLACVDHYHRLWRRAKQGIDTGASAKASHASSKPEDISCEDARRKHAEEW